MKKVVQPGLEPETFELLAQRSNQLSYKTFRNTQKNIHLSQSINNMEKITLDRQAQKDIDSYIDYVNNGGE